MTPPFDARRAHLNPTDERPLRNVLESGEILPETELVITERAAPTATKTTDDPTPLAFIDHQLAFHHVAQGEIAGHPWMVSF
jgi:hypothetical protein